MELSAKVVLITGASRGIGAACAAAFRKGGARLSLTARSQDLLRAVGGEDALLMAGDITDPAVRRRVVDGTINRYGAIDVLVNNAGIGLYAPSWRAPMEDARALFELNVFAPLAMTQLVAPHMRQRRSGLIVNIGSIAGRMPLPWLSLYSATKYALGAMTEGLRMELRQDGIRTMIVCPGYVKTGFQDHVLAGKPPEQMRRSRKLAITAEACAEAVVKGVKRDARTVVTPAIGWGLIALQRLFPVLMEWQLARIYENQEPER
ncbi:MAG: SDR family NAD(P)-dependent oxidoreductase [Candidatus Solibacter usitatus]|nr:SDR family NAD(P)-dependent oxidoreductase [Candidatus Solibacter usitatus]